MVVLIFLLRYTLNSSQLNPAGSKGRVIVGLDSDAKVRNSKSSTRPINTFVDRKIMLEAIRYIDLVLEFSDRKGLENLIQMVKPDIMLLGGDWRNGDVVGRDYCLGCQFLDRGRISSTKSSGDVKMNRVIPLSLSRRDGDTRSGL